MPRTLRLSGSFPALPKPSSLALLAVLILCTAALAGDATLPAIPDPHKAPLRVMVGQMVMAGFRGATLDPSNPIVRDIRERHLGGVILFDYDVERKSSERNILNPTQVRKLTADIAGLADIPLFIAVDQEGGRVQRLKATRGFIETPSAAELGARDAEASFEAGLNVGRQLRDLGFNLDFAPVLDLHRPGSPAIGDLERAFAADPDKAARLGAAFARGLREAGVLTCVKHFPGHGSARADSHLGFTDVTETWQTEELTPFARVIQAGLADMVMTAHLYNARLDETHPATLSETVIRGLLRGELGFSGLVVTDDLQMRAVTDRYGLEEAVRLAVRSGADVLLFGNNLRYEPQAASLAMETIVSLVETGEMSRRRIERSFARIMALKNRLRYNAINP